MARRVLFVIYSFSLGGGAEKVLSYLLDGLSKRGGYEIDLLEVHHEDVSWEPLPDSVTVLPPVFDETLTGLLARVKRGVLRRVSEMSPALLRRAVRSSKSYDLAVSFNYMVPSLLLKPGEKSISWNHGSIECLKDEPRKAKKQRRAYGDADRVVAISERTAKSITDLFPEVFEKLSVIHNGFPIDDIISAGQKSAEMSVLHPAVMCVGRLDANKNPLGVLEGFKSILHEAPDAHLYYLGTGDLEASLLGAVKSSGLSESVHLLGYQENPYPLISQADCIVSLSRAEGFQSVFVEGFTFGIPFISSSAGSAEELAAACDGGVVIDDVVDAGRAFLELQDRKRDPEYGEKLKSYAETLSIQAFVDSFESLAAEVIGGAQ